LGSGLPLAIPARNGAADGRLQAAGAGAVRKDDPGLDKLHGDVCPGNEGATRIAAAGIYVANVAIGSGYPVIGTADTIPRQMQVFAETGLAGVLMNWANPVHGLQRPIKDVLPRLEAAGLRAPHRRQ